MKKLKIFILIALSSVIFMPLTVASADTPVALELAPPIQTLNLHPGDVQSIKTYVKNSSSSDLLVKVSFNDFSPNADGTPKLLTGGKKNSTYGLSSWLTGPSSFTVATHAIYTYTATITVPAKLAQTSYGYIKFEPTNSTLSGTGASLGSSVGALVLANIGTPVLKGSIDNFIAIKTSVTDLTNAKATYAMTIKNSGSYMFKPTLSVKIIDNDNNTVATLEPKKTGYVLPESSRIFTFEWTGKLDATKTYTAVPSGVLPDGTVLSGRAASIELYKPAVSATSANQTAKTKSKFPILPVAIGLALVVLSTLAILIVLRRKKKKANTVTANNAIPLPTQPVELTDQPSQSNPPQPPIV